MKKAKLWAYLMSGLLTFSTLASDYQIAYAEEAVEADAAGAVDVIEEPKLGEADGFVMQMVGSGAPVEGGEEDSDTPDEPAVLEEGETEGDGSSDKIPVVEGTDGKLIEQEESDEPSESDAVADGVVADSDTVNKEETLTEPVYVNGSFEKTVEGTVTDVTLSDTGAGSYVISDDKSKVTFTAGDTAKENVSMVITYSTVEEGTTVEGTTLTVKFSIAENTTETETETNEPVSATARASVDTGDVFDYTLSGGIFSADDIVISDADKGTFTVSGEHIYFTAGDVPTDEGAPVVLTITYKTEKDGNTVEGNKCILEFTINQAEASDTEPFDQTVKKVTASAQAGVFPANTTLVVSSGSETKERLEPLVKVEYGDKYEIVGCDSFDITFKRVYPYEQTVQPKSGSKVNLSFDYTYAGATKYVLFQGNAIAGEGKSIDTATFPQWTIVGIKENTEVEKKIITNGVDGCTVKYSVEWDNKDTTPTPYFGVEGGSAVFHSEYPNDSKKRDLVAGDIIEIPSGVQQSAVDARLTGYHIEWKNYEKKSDIRVHINGFLIGTATVKYIDDNTNKVFHTETIENCRWNSTCSVSNTTYPGYTYVGSANPSVQILNANAADNVIELRYVKDIETTYKIERYSGTGDQATLIPDGSVSVPVSLSGGNDLTVTLTSAQTDFNGYKFRSSVPEDGQITIKASDTAEHVIKLYYDKLSGYTVQYYLADKKGDYSSSYSSAETVENCEKGSTQSFDTKENEYKTFNNILYTYEKADPASASVTISSEEPAGNIIKVYYKMFWTVYDRDNKNQKIESRERDGKNEVYFSLIYPYYGIPSVNSQDVKKFYPTNWLNHEPVVQGRWRGTADFLPAGEWNVYDANGINFADYGITMDADAKRDFDAYLGLFGGPDNVDVIWYNYKCDAKKYVDDKGVRQAWFVNGIIVQKSGEPFEYVVYDQNFEGGTKRTDNNLPKNDFYTIKGKDGDSMADLTIREGWTFKGWATSSEGPVQYQPGGRVDLATPYHFYAIWEKAPVSDLVTITAPSKSKVYDGYLLDGSQVTIDEGVTWDGLPDGYRVVNAVTHGSIQNVKEGDLIDEQGYYALNEFGSGDLMVEDLGSDGTGSSSAKPYVILDDKGNDVTSLFTNVTLIPGKLRITPLPLIVTTGSASKYYDGTPLTCAEADIKTADGVSVNNKFAVVVATGSVTDVTPTPVDNTYEPTWLDVDPNNFSITEKLGKLEVKSNPTPPSVKKVTLTAASASRVYNGEELTATSVTAKGLPAGYTYTATATGSRTDVGDSVNEVASDYVIYNASHAVATSEFEVETVKGTISVLPRPVTVKTGTKSKVYDGTPLVCEEASITNLAEGDVVTVKATGTITEVGSTPNTYEIDWGTVNKGNYTVSEELGTLTISETNEEILVTVIGGTYLYDGEAHGPIITVTGAGISYTNDASNGTPIDNLGAGEAAYFVEEASSTTKLIDVSSEATDVNKLVIRNASGADVTSKLKITKDTSNSTVKVVPVPVTITTKSASKVYDGSALTAGGSIDGLVAKDKAEVVFTVTGSQKEVGSSKNTYSLDWGIASPDNYTVTENIGTLRVTAVDDPTPDDPTGDPDTPSGDPDTPSGDPTPTPGPGPDPNPVVPNITPGTPNPADGVPAIVPTATTTIPDDAVPLAGVLGETRGIEADAASVLGARVPAAQGVLGARRDAQTADSNQMALYLILMGIATGVGGAYISSRRHKRDFLNDLEMMQ